MSTIANIVLSPATPFNGWSVEVENDPNLPDGGTSTFVVALTRTSSAIDAIQCDVHRSPQIDAGLMEYVITMRDTADYDGTLSICSDCLPGYVQQGVDEGHVWKTKAGQQLVQPVYVQHDLVERVAVLEARIREEEAARVKSERAVNELAEIMEGNSRSMGDALRDAMKPWIGEGRISMDVANGILSEIGVEEINTEVEVEFDITVKVTVDPQTVFADEDEAAAWLDNAIRNISVELAEDHAAGEQRPLDAVEISEMRNVRFAE